MLCFLLKPSKKQTNNLKDVPPPSSLGVAIDNIHLIIVDYSIVTGG